MISTMTEPDRGALVSRRSFLGGAALGTAAVFLDLPLIGDEPAGAGDALRFGLIADVHQDIMHDAARRVGLFVNALNGAGADFVCELGDFCQPHERNRKFFDQWKRFEGPCHHVLGNHDMDGGYSREETAAYYGMPGLHYSFDLKGVHIVVLDGNDPGGKAQGYKRYIAAEQAEWLAEDLARTELPTLIFSHQPLDHGGGIENGAVIRKILETANSESGKKKVMACFSGHLHQDYARTMNGILYVQINSASYLWLPERFVHKSYSDEIHEAHPWIKHTAPYKDPLWALVTVDLYRGVLAIQGKRTEWIGPDPWKLGASDKDCDPRTVGPRISDWRIPF